MSRLAVCVGSNRLHSPFPTYCKTGAFWVWCAMTTPSNPIALPVSQRPRSPLFSVRLEPSEVRHHPRDHVLHLIVKHCQWRPSDGDFREKRDTSRRFALGAGSCTVVPDKLRMAYTARHNLVGKRQQVASTTQLEDVSYVPVWAIAISASNYRAMLHGNTRNYTDKEWKANLLRFGGKEAVRYKTTTPEDVTLVENTTGKHAHYELCILKFEDNLAGPVDVISRFHPNLLSDKETFEVIQIGFPDTYCANPRRGEWVQPLVLKAVDVVKSGIERVWSKVSSTAPLPSEPRSVLQWLANNNSEQMQSKFYCDREDAENGQDDYTLRLPCTAHHGDSGGAVYLVFRDNRFGGKKKFSLLGIITGGLSGLHVAYAWPANDATEKLLAAAEWQRFLPEVPADRRANPARQLAVAGGASASSAS